MQIEAIQVKMGGPRKFDMRIAFSVNASLCFWSASPWTYTASVTAPMQAPQSLRNFKRLASAALQICVVGFKFLPDAAAELQQVRGGYCSSYINFRMNLSEFRVWGGQQQSPWLQPQSPSVFSHLGLLLQWPSLSQQSKASYHHPHCGWTYNHALLLCIAFCSTCCPMTMLLPEAPYFLFLPESPNKLYSCFSLLVSWGPYLKYWQFGPAPSIEFSAHLTGDGPSEFDVRIMFGVTTVLQPQVSWLITAA